VPQGRRLLRTEATPELVRLDPVDRQPLAAELEHGQPCAVHAFELRLAGDVNLVELEPELGLERRQLLPRALAEVAVAGDVEREPAQG
jgi:hypothetical protein